jgi:retron-type reverse transcriptase
MFGLGPATRIYLAVDAVDMRKGFDGLYGLVRDHLGHDPLSGHLFLFTNRSHTRNKALDWELLLRAVRKHAPNRWVVIYIERWLKAPAMREDGILVPREQGTPQGGVIAPARDVRGVY